MKDLKNKGKNWIGIAVLLVGAVLLTMVLAAIDMQPSGGDIWGHLYKSEVMYENLKDGTFYPLFDMKWYNGIQLYRYWPPMSYYVMAGLLAVTGGKQLLAYHVLAGVVFFLGGLPWVLWGNVEGRRVLGTVFGVLWFFMPETIRIYFCAGNLPQMITTTIVPYIIFFLWLFVRRQKNPAAIGLYIGMLLMTFTHLMVTAIMGVSAFLYLVVDEIRNRDFRRKLAALIVMVTGIMTAGIWVVPSLKGGMITTEQSGDSVMSTLIYPLSVSLNPLYRIYHGRDSFYFGLGIVLLSILGILLAKGHKKAGFIFLLVILVFTTPATYPVLSKLPLSQLFWMTRFTPMVYGFFFCSMMEWTRLKKKYCVVAMAILLLDLVPSFVLSQYGVITPEDTIADVRTLREETTQRTAIIDISSYGSYPSYGVCGADGVNYTYGWAWQGAVTGDNIVLLNEALENERYLFLFDRCLELGDDTVLIRKSYVGKNGGTKEQMIAAAQKSGYALDTETEGAYIFRHETPEQFGVATQYQGIVIGKYANAMTTAYPSFTTGSYDEIDEYTFDQLKDYRTIFLTGFEYHDKETAQQLLEQLAQSGVRIVIDATHMPADAKTKQETFLGVTNQQVHFQNQYPVLTYHGNKISTGAFAADDADFSTGYLAEVDHAEGTFELGDRKLTFLGYNDANPNIYFLGINLMYYAVSTNDQAAFVLLNEVLKISNDQLPVRELVPLTVEQEGNTLRIRVEDDSVWERTDHVNTTIAYQDIFSSDQRLEEENQLLQVYAADTEIVLKYPLLAAGIFVSLLGFLSGVVVLYCICKPRTHIGGEE